MVWVLQGRQLTIQAGTAPYNGRCLFLTIYIIFIIYNITTFKESLDFFEKDPTAIMGTLYAPTLGMGN